MAKKKYQIPFRSGNLVWKPSRHHPSNISWYDNFQFTDTLEFLNFKIERGTGCAYFRSVSSNSCYNMSLHDFDAVIKRNLFYNNVITGDFTFVKRGTSYFMVPIFRNSNALTNFNP